MNFNIHNETNLDFNENNFDNTIYKYNELNRIKINYNNFPLTLEEKIYKLNRILEKNNIKPKKYKINTYEEHKNNIYIYE
jgi:hypothetical protein